MDSRAQQYSPDTMVSKSTAVAVVVVVAVVIVVAVVVVVVVVAAAFVAVVNGRLSFQFSSAQFRSRWYLCAQKSPYALHPASENVPNVAFETAPMFV